MNLKFEKVILELNDQEFKDLKYILNRFYNNFDKDKSDSYTSDTERRISLAKNIIKKQ